MVVWRCMTAALAAQEPINAVPGVCWDGPRKRAVGPLTELLYACVCWLMGNKIHVLLLYYFFHIFLQKIHEKDLFLFVNPMYLC